MNEIISKNTYVWVIKILAVIAAVFIIMCPKTVQAASSGTSGGCTWELDDDGVLSIYPTDGTSGTLGTYSSFAFVPWYSNRTSITSLSISDGVSATSLSWLFYGCSNLSSDGLSEELAKIDTSGLTSLNNTFYGCSSITELDLSGWDVSSVTGMMNLFRDCTALTSLGLSGWDTSSLTSATNIFYNCSSLATLNLSGWDTSSLTSATNMFYNCTSLSAINLSSTFKFIEISFSLYCEPSTTDPYTGYWTYGDAYNHYSGHVKSASELKGYYDGTATLSGWWYWEKDEDDDNTIESYISEDNYYTGDGDASDTYPADSYGGFWSKLNNNSFQYTFYVYDADQGWYVWEEDIDGYTSDYTNYITADGASVVEITNTSEDTDDGYIKITKRVLDSDGTDTSDNGTYYFTITILDSDGNAVSSGTYGDVVIGSNGTGTFSLTDDGSVTISGLPDMSEITIYESTGSGYTFVSCTGQYGILDDSTGATATTFEITPSSGTVTISDMDDADFCEIEITNQLNGEETLGFTLEKQITGNYEYDETEYDFTVIINGLSTGDEIKAAYSDGDTESFTAQSSALSLDISLAADESVYISGLPESATYIVSEEAGDWVSSYTVTDANSLNKIASASSANTEENMDLSTATETADSGEDITITFTNKISQTADLVVTKTVIPADEEGVLNDTFEITVSLTGLSASTKYAGSFGSFTSDADGNAEITLSLSSGDEAYIYDLPVGATYTVSEGALASYISSYEITDEGDTDNPYAEIISSEGSNSEVKTSISTETETVNAGEEITVEIINTETEDKTVPIKLYKYDGSGNLIGPAAYALYTSDGEYLTEIEIDENGESDGTYELGVGDYYLVETAAPSGYAVNDTKLEFSITESDLSMKVFVIKLTDSALNVLYSSGGIGIYVFIATSIFAAAIFAMAAYKKRNIFAVK